MAGDVPLRAIRAFFRLSFMLFFSRPTGIQVLDWIPPLLYCFSALMWLVGRHMGI